MKKGQFTFLAALFLLTSCTKQFNNQKVYRCEIGKVVEIYYSTNSCCFYCVRNETSLKHIQSLGKTIINPSSKDCDGCDFTGAFKFKALSIGRDTIYLKHNYGGQNCDDSLDINQEVYIVEVK